MLLDCTWFRGDLARIPAKWNHFAEKDSRQISMLEQILIAKVFNFGGFCSKSAMDLLYCPSTWRPKEKAQATGFQRWRTPILAAWATASVRLTASSFSNNDAT